MLFKRYPRLRKALGYFALSLILPVVVSVTFLGKKTYAHHEFVKTQEKFINYMRPNILKENNEIRDERHKLLAYYADWLKHDKLTKAQHEWVEELAEKYRVADPDLTTEASWNELKRRVDIIPPALVMAQAIHESNWGRSRFALQGHNYFGQWCFYPGCGIVPLRRPAGATYEVEKYDNSTASIESYMLNLNTNLAFSEFRKLREREREHHQKLNALKLVDGLELYSEQREAYVRSIKTTIEEYNLQNVM